MSGVPLGKSAGMRPGAMVFATGSAEQMIANCDVLITRFSSTAFVGLALGKETYSDYSMDEMRRLMAGSARLGGPHTSRMSAAGFSKRTSESKILPWRHPSDTLFPCHYRMLAATLAVLIDPFSGSAITEVCCIGSRWSAP